MTRTVMGRVAWAAGAALVLFACARPFAKKESAEPASTTTAPAPAPAPVLSSPPLPTQLGDDAEDPTQMPVPVFPFARENRNPEVILKNIPKDQGGSVDWVRAFKDNLVHPRESLDPDKPLVPPFDFNIDIPAVGAMPNVVFPHLPHTYWLPPGERPPTLLVMEKGA